MTKEIMSHVCFDLRAHNMTDGGHIVIGGGVDDPQNYVNDSAFQYQLACQVCNVFGCRAGDFTNDHREDQLAKSGQTCAKQIADHYGHMGAIIRQKFTKKSLFSFCLGCFHKISILPLGAAQTVIEEFCRVAKFMRETVQVSVFESHFHADTLFFCQ